MKNIVVIGLLLLAGCASTLEDHQKDLRTLVGQSVEVAVQKFGRPLKYDLFDVRGSQVIEYYYWSASGEGVERVPTTATTVGNFGGVFYNQNTYSSTTRTIALRCEVRALFNARTKIIVDVEARGNACDFYTDKL